MLALLLSHIITCYSFGYFSFIASFVANTSPAAFSARTTIIVADHRHSFKTDHFIAGSFALHLA